MDLNVRFSSVFPVTFVGAIVQAEPPKHAWPNWEPLREHVTENDKLRAANNLNDRWSREGRQAVIIYQLAERDLIPRALERDKPFFYLDGDDYQVFKAAHDKEFPVYQQDELAADWNRGEWSKRFLRVCQALGDRLTNIWNASPMKVDASRWGRTTVLEDPSLTSPALIQQGEPNPSAPLPISDASTGSLPDAVTSTSHTAPIIPSTPAFTPNDAAPTAA